MLQEEIISSTDGKTTDTVVQNQNIEQILETFKKIIDVKGIDKKNIPLLLVSCMSFVGNDFKTLSGLQKKELVIKLLQHVCPDDTIDIMIPMMIDVLVSVDKGDLKINPSITTGFRDFFKCLKCW